jgi:hypothetical protein
MFDLFQNDENEEIKRIREEKERAKKEKDRGLAIELKKQHDITIKIAYDSLGGKMAVDRLFESAQRNAESWNGTGASIHLSLKNIDAMIFAYSYLPAITNFKQMIFESAHQRIIQMLYAIKYKLVLERDAIVANAMKNHEVDKP